MKYLTTLTGPSCAGKTTLEARMEQMGVLRAVSCTTRAPRAGERDGVDYYFLSVDKFLTMKHCEMFVESAKFGEHHYGLSTAELARLHMKGDHVVVVCEPQGAKQIRNYCADHPEIELCQVFVDNPQPVIIRRVMNRFLLDYTVAKVKQGTSFAQRVMEAHCQRLLIMGGVEKGWIAEAYSDAHPTLFDAQVGAFHYDRLIERFDEFNIDEIATSLVAQKAPALV